MTYAVLTPTGQTRSSARREKTHVASVRALAAPSGSTRTSWRLSPRSWNACPCARPTRAIEHRAATHDTGVPRGPARGRPRTGRPGTRRRASRRLSPRGRHALLRASPAADARGRPLPRVVPARRRARGHDDRPRRLSRPAGGEREAESRAPSRSATRSRLPIGGTATRPPRRPSCCGARRSVASATSSPAPSPTTSRRSRSSDELGFTQTGEAMDEEDGLELVFELER